MFLQTINPDISAFQLAGLLADKMEKEIPLSYDVNPGEFFQFDPDKMIVVCSRKSIGLVAEEEAASAKTVVSYRSVLRLADNVLGETAGIPECVRYAVFSCLHEIGHYEQALSWGPLKTERKATERERLVEEAKAEVGAMSKGGILPPAAYVVFEQKCRLIPAEKDADERASNMLSQIAEVV